MSDGAPPSHQGEEAVWSIVATLLAGPLVWGGVGWGVDSVAGTARVFTALGVVLGFVCAFYIVYVRYVRD